MIYFLPIQFFFFFYRISLVIYLFESRGRKNHASSVKLAALAHSCLTRTARDLHFRDFRTFYPVRYPLIGVAQILKNSAPRSL